MLLDCYIGKVRCLSKAKQGVQALRRIPIIPIFQLMEHLGNDLDIYPKLLVADATDVNVEPQIMIYISQQPGINIPCSCLPSTIETLALLLALHACRMEKKPEGYTERREICNTRVKVVICVPRGRWPMGLEKVNGSVEDLGSRNKY